MEGLPPTVPHGRDSESELKTRIWNHLGEIKSAIREKTKCGSREKKRRYSHVRIRALITSRLSHHEATRRTTRTPRELHVTQRRVHATAREQTSCRAATPRCALGTARMERAPPASSGEHEHMQAPLRSDRRWLTTRAAPQTPKMERPRDRGGIASHPCGQRPPEGLAPAIRAAQHGNARAHAPICSCATIDEQARPVGPKLQPAARPARSCTPLQRPASFCDSRTTIVGTITRQVVLSYEQATLTSTETNNRVWAW